MKNKKRFETLLRRYRNLLRNQAFSEAQRVLDQMKGSYPSNAWYHQGLLIGIRAYSEKTSKNVIPQQRACFEKSLAYNPHIMNPHGDPWECVIWNRNNTRKPNRHSTIASSTPATTFSAETHCGFLPMSRCTEAIQNEPSGC